MIISEPAMLDKLKKAKNVLLVEPNYQKKYPPLGLAKIATFLKNNKAKVTYARELIGEEFDLICITSLFTYYSKFVTDILNSRGFIHSETPILVGGVLASILPEIFDKYENVDVFTGYSKVLDGCVPDKSIMLMAEEPFNEFSFIFTSRGCPNKCAYCTVWRIEKERWVNEKWKSLIDLDKPNVMISDNNLSAVTFDHLKAIIDFVVENNKKIMFDNGFDCKYVTKEMAAQLARARYTRTGMRLAFDRIEEDGTFQKAVKTIIDAGVPASSIMIYVLFNFQDKPHDAYYRARECVRLGVRPYPQYYRPLKILTKSEIFVGKYWTLGLGRAFRNYWLMRGIFSKQSFDQYVHSKECIAQFRLTQKDITCWETNGGTMKAGTIGEHGIKGSVAGSKLRKILIKKQV